MRVRPLAFLLLAVSLIVPEVAAAETIIVKREGGLSPAERADLRADAGVRLVETLPLPRTEVVKAPAGAAREALRALRADDDVVYAELDHQRRVFEPDPKLAELWALENTGLYGALPDADIDGVEAWSQSIGAGQTVAVVDSGADVNHPDLAGRIHADSRNFVGTDGPAVTDGDGHGTHVTGTIVATRDNGVGIAGVAPGATVMALKALADDGSGYDSDIAAAFAYAGQKGVPVVNASLGGPDPSTTLHIAIAAYPGTLFVIAAGNSGTDNDVAPQYPCNVPEPNVLCVGASTDHDRRASFSNYGDESVDLFAPGEWIYSTVPGGGYVYMHGTSMAAPHVAGVAALILARRPDLDPEEVKSALLDAAEAKPAFDGLSVQPARLNAAASVAAVVGLPADSLDTSDPSDPPPAVTSQPPARTAPQPPAPPANPPRPPADGDGDGRAGASDGCPTEHAVTADGCPLPALASLSAKARRRTATVRVKASRAATVRVTVQRKRCKRSRCRWTRVTRKTVITRTGSAKVRVRRLRRGSYRVVVVLSSSAGRGSAASTGFKVR